MLGVQTDEHNETDIVERSIDRRVSPWKWAFGLGLYFVSAQIFAVIGSENPSWPSYMWIILVMQFLPGAVLGALAAFAARNIVKAIRC